VTSAISAATDALMAIEKWCDHHVFYHRVRPFLAGWPAPGIRFEGVDDRPRILAGGSAAQSSLIQAFDAGLGITHDAPSTSGFLGGMRRFMPAGHRRFLDDLRAGPSVREFAGADRDPEPVEAYDGAVRALTALRHKHIGIAARYVRRFERDDGGKGTGGSDFVHFLRTSKEETARGLLR
jgi:indoleamine 2,3-dioxygenase